MQLLPDHPSANHDQCKWWQESKTGPDQRQGTQLEEQKLAALSVERRNLNS